MKDKEEEKWEGGVARHVRKADQSRWRRSAGQVTGVGVCSTGGVRPGYSAICAALSRVTRHCVD